MFLKLRSRMFNWLLQADQIVKSVHLVPIPQEDMKWAIKSYQTRTQTHLGTAYSTTSPTVTRIEELSSQSMQFKVFRGAGGVAIEVSQYLPRTDEERCTLYIIPEDKDLGEEIAKIITLQSML